MKTIKKLIEEHKELHHRIRVWEEIRGFLEKCEPSGTSEPLNRVKMSDGSVVDEEIIQGIISEVDDMVAILQKRIFELEQMEVGSAGKGNTGEKARPKRVQSKRARKSNARAGKAAGKGGGKDAPS